MEVNYIVSVILVAAYGVFLETLLLAGAGIPVNNGFGIFALGFQLISFPALTWHAQREIKQRKRLVAREVKCRNAQF